jgi:Ca2+-binding EF-hand superfamily protein
MWYKSVDVNHNGVVSLEDMKECGENFTELHHFLGNKADSVTSDIDAWWRSYILPCFYGSVSEEQFLFRLSAYRNKHKATFEAEMKRCFNEIFVVFDTNKNGVIEFSEFTTAYKAYGHENESLLTNAFNHIKGTNDVIHIRDIVSIWVQFVTNDDSSKPDDVSEAFELGL